MPCLSKPTYSNEELRRIKEDSFSKVTYKGKEMTKYEATQKRNAYERSLRNLKNEQKQLLTAGDELGASTVQGKINAKSKEWKDFCSQVGLRPDTVNAGVSGYRKISVSPLTKLSKTDMMWITKYTSSSSYTINDALRSGVVLDDELSQFKNGLNLALDKLPKYIDVVYRSVSDTFMDEVVFNKEHSVGETIYYKAFTSSSKKIYDERMKYQFIIESKTGRDISLINKGEQEVLFKTDCEFVITRREGNTIYMEEV